MKILIIGAGGIGCYYGAKLQKAGHAVSYLARGDHLIALQKKGLNVTHPDFKFIADVEALNLDQLFQKKNCDHYDLVILTTKGEATKSILDDLEAWFVDSNTPILSLQNGVDNEALIANIIGEERTLGGLAVRIGGHIVAPGNIEVSGVAQIIFGAWPNAQKGTDHQQEFIDHLLNKFNHAGIPTQVSNNIQYELWRKLIINNGVNPLSALTGLDTRTLTAHPDLTQTVYQLMQEVALVAKADEVELTKHDVDEMYELICTFDAIKTSMLVDKEKGRPMELETICGAVLKRANKLGVSTPITQLVNALLRLQNT